MKNFAVIYLVDISEVGAAVYARFEPGVWWFWGVLAARDSLPCLCNPPAVLPDRRSPSHVFAAPRRLTAPDPVLRCTCTAVPQVPDFNAMYELYDPCTVMFFFRNKVTGGVGWRGVHVHERVCYTSTPLHSCIAPATAPHCAPHAPRCTALHRTAHCKDNYPDRRPPCLKGSLFATAKPQPRPLLAPTRLHGRCLCWRLWASWPLGAGSSPVHPPPRALFERGHSPPHPSPPHRVPSPCTHVNTGHAILLHPSCRNHLPDSLHTSAGCGPLLPVGCGPFDSRNSERCSLLAPAPFSPCLPTHLPH